MGEFTPTCGGGPTRRWRRRFGRAAAFAACLVAGVGAPRVPAAHAQSDLRAAAVKAAFVYNFAKFTEWPPGTFGSQTTPIELCFYDNSLAPAALAQLREKRIGARIVVIRQFEDIPPSGVCHVVYIGGQVDGTKLRDIIQYGEKSHVLTVSDAPRFAEEGGHIGLYSADNRLRFRINLEAARSSHISLSARLLQLAVIVEKQGRE